MTATKTRNILIRTGIALGVLIIVLLSISLVYLYRMQSEINKMTPLESGDVASGVYAIRGNSYVNLYIVKGKNGLVAFDSGEKRNTVEKEMAELHLDPSKVEAVFLTHSDSDHVGGLGLFSNASVYLAAGEEQMINGTTAKSFIFKNKISRPYTKLMDNQTVEVAGLEVRCILTPGHTPGSMSYVVDDIYLFPGDTLSLKNNRIALFNDFFNMDTERERDSITKLSELPGLKYIFTTHYGFSDNYEESFAGWEGN